MHLQTILKYLWSDSKIALDRKTITKTNRIGIKVYKENV